MKKIYLVATIIAIIAGFATYFFAIEIKKDSSIKDVEKANVVVARQDIPANTILTEDMLMVANLPVTSVTGGSVANIEDVVGYMTLQTIASGEQLLANRVAIIGQDSMDKAHRLSYKLEKGHYAYCISVDNLQGICGFLKEGDCVDIYQISPETENKTTLLIQNVKIFRLSNYTANLAQEAGSEIISYSELVLDVTREQLMIISDAQRNATLRFALVPYAAGADVSGEVDESLSEREIVTNAPGIIVSTSETAAS